MRSAFARFATACATLVGSPQAFALTVVLILVWLVAGPFAGWSDSWQLIANTGTTIATTLLVLLVQNTQNRTDRALHVKLDELLVSLREPDSSKAGIEKLTDDELDRLATHQQ